MAVTYDTTASGTFGHDDGAGGATTATQAITCAAGASLVVQVPVGLKLGDTTGFTCAVTYNGVAMTSLVRVKPASNTCFQEVFGLLNCGDGSSHNIVVTLGGTATNCGIGIGAVSATGVNAFDGVVSTSSSGTNSPAQSVTSASGDLVVGLLAHGDTITGQSNTGRYSLQLPINTTAGSNFCGQTAAGAGSVAIAATSSITDSWTVVGVNMSAGAAGAVDGLGGPSPLVGPGAVGDMGFQWRQVTGVDSTAVSADVNVTGVLDVGGVLYATVSHDTGVAGLLETAEFLSATPVGHDATVAGVLPAGVVPYAPVGHDSVVAGLLEVGGFVITGDPSSNLNTFGVLFAGLTPLATVTHTAGVAGVLPAGGVLYGPVSHNATLTGHLPLAAVSYAPVAHNATVAGLLEAGAVLLNGPSFDYNVAGFLPIGVAPRSTVTTDRTVVGVFPAGVSFESTVTTTRAVVGVIEWAALPSGLITRTVSLVGYLPSGLVLVGTGASGIVASDVIVAPTYRELAWVAVFADGTRADGYRERSRTDIYRGTL